MIMNYTQLHMQKKSRSKVSSFKNIVETDRQTTDTTDFIAFLPNAVGKYAHSTDSYAKLYIAL